MSYRSAGVVDSINALRSNGMTVEQCLRFRFAQTTDVDVKVVAKRTTRGWRSLLPGRFAKLADPKIIFVAQGGRVNRARDAGRGRQWV